MQDSRGGLSKAGQRGRIPSLTPCPRYWGCSPGDSALPTGFWGAASEWRDSCHPPAAPHFGSATPRCSSQQRLQLCTSGGAKEAKDTKLLLGALPSPPQEDNHTIHLG